MAAEAQERREGEAEEGRIVKWPDSEAMTLIAGALCILIGMMLGYKIIREECLRGGSFSSFGVEFECRAVPAKGE